MTRANDSTESGDLIFLEPVFHAKVWGGTRLRDLYGYALPGGEKIGECLAISARPEGDCVVSRGPMRGMALSTLWEQRRDLFGGVDGDAFPLQVKILDAVQDLSVQVHPDADGAARHGEASGKNECWYVLHASETGKVVIGHEADTREEFAKLAEQGRWDELLRFVEMEEGGSHFIPAGTVHAILAGSLVYEVQQSSDVTYRLHDYDRFDGGARRELHVEKALDVIAAPSRPAPVAPSVFAHDGATQIVYYANDFFTLSKWEVGDAATIPVDSPFLLVSALEGSGTVNGTAVAAGDHFIVSSGVPRLEVTGPLTLMVTSP
jgi:mannose-6-phosphate isomerase